MSTCTFSSNPANWDTNFYHTVCVPLTRSDKKITCAPGYTRTLYKSPATGKPVVCQYSDKFGIQIRGKYAECSKQVNKCSQADSCCTTGKPPSGMKCDVNYVPSNANCESAMAAYCKDTMLFSEAFPRGSADFCN